MKPPIIGGFIVVERRAAGRRPRPDSHTPGLGALEATTSHRKTEHLRVLIEDSQSSIDIVPATPVGLSSHATSASAVP
jgi:hypothetical protein